uniref:Uncharacterized protein n=1 Tax=Setaria viridis TaxID=4556 RepID=A0A4U6W5U0_SETVI|nr:hypothetical protein SEVIR_2G196032v2 [Setaria viridis]
MWLCNKCVNCKHCCRMIDRGKVWPHEHKTHVTFTHINTNYDKPNPCYTLKGNCPYRGLRCGILDER